MNKSYIEKRSRTRIPANVEAKFFCCNRMNSGLVMNISEKGMFISVDELCFPFDSQFEVHLCSGNSAFRSFVNLIRVEMSPSYSDGVGVEIPDPSEEYLNLVSTLRFAG